MVHFERRLDSGNRFKKSQPDRLCVLIWAGHLVEALLAQLLLKQQHTSKGDNT
jgi:hypothetical protein